MRLRPFLAAALVAASLSATAGAQSQRSLYNQDRLAELLYANRAETLDAVPQVSYRYYTLGHESGNSVLARHALYQEAGGGDARTGRDGVNGMVAFLNGVFIQNLGAGDTIVLPSEVGADPRAYSPFPLVYEGGEGLDKLFVIDKGVQA